MESTNYVYAQAKIEYTKQLIDLLQDEFFDSFMEMYRESKQSTSKQTLLSFREKLEGIPEWNQTQINELSQSMIKCDFLEDLITAVYLTHTKILLSVGKRDPLKKIDLVIPKTTNFLHRCFISIARELWKNPYLYEEDISATDYQRNIQSIETIISDKIEQTIRSSLPVKDILQGQLESNPNMKEDTVHVKDSILDDILERDRIHSLQNGLTHGVPNHRITPEPMMYDGPSEQQIKTQTENIVVNDDLLKDTREDVYDNPELFSEKSNDDSKYVDMVKQETSSNYYTGDDYEVDRVVNKQPVSKKSEVEMEPSEVKTTIEPTVEMEPSEVKTTIEPSEVKTTIEPSEVKVETIEPTEVKVETIEPKVETIEPTVETIEPTEVKVEPEPSEKDTKSKETIVIKEPGPVQESKETSLFDVVQDESKDKVGELMEHKKIQLKRSDDTDTLDNFFDDLKEMTAKDKTTSLFDK
tara:strand:- start:1030 stop:2436 length:1407 start_codon:yes stop_codon:yes gene_type:complete